MNAARKLPEEHFQGPWDIAGNVIKTVLVNQGVTGILLIALIGVGCFGCYALDKHWVRQAEALEEVRQAELLQSQKFDDAMRTMANSTSRGETILRVVTENSQIIKTVVELLKEQRDKQPHPDGAYIPRNRYDQLEAKVKEIEGKTNSPVNR